MPTPARTVQLRNVPDVITAYENWDCPAFAIWNNKQLLFTYDREDASVEEGSQLLQQWLELIERNGSAGIYTLAIYRDQKKSITNSTPYNGSVNFQLNEYNYNGQPGSLNGPSDPGLKLIMDKMATMQLEMERIKNSKEEEEEEETDTDAIGQITSLLNHPVIAGLISAILPGNKQLPVSTMKPVSDPVAPGGTATRIAGMADTENDQVRIAEALKRLQAKVPDLPGMMERLAAFAETKPVQFKLYLASLMNMDL